MMRFEIRFLRIRAKDDAHATLAQISDVAESLEAAEAKARFLFETLDMPQRPDALEILDPSGEVVLCWKRPSAALEPDAEHVLESRYR